MINRSELTPIGAFLKPHGIKGEIAAELDIDCDSVMSLSCIVVEMDGIYVPFFIGASRPKGRDTALLTVDGVGNENEAAQFAGKTVYAKADEIEGEEGEDSAGTYVTDMAGYTIVNPEGDTVGKIDYVDDSTQNILFVVETPTQETVYIPAAPELMTALDLDRKTITMELPEGLL